MRNNSESENAQNAFFTGIKASFTAFVGISWGKANPADIFTNGDWMLSQSQTTSLKSPDLVVLGTVKLKHRRSTSLPTMRGGDVPKRNYAGIHYRFQRDLTSSRSIVRWTLDLLWIPNYVIKKGPHGNKEMHQKGFWRNSRSFPERSNISWIATQHWSNWRSMHPDGQGRAERFHPTHLDAMNRWNCVQTSTKH